MTKIEEAWATLDTKVADIYFRAGEFDLPGQMVLRERAEADLAKARATARGYAEIIALFMDTTPEWVSTEAARRYGEIQAGRTPTTPGVI